MESLETVTSLIDSWIGIATVVAVAVAHFFKSVRAAYGKAARKIKEAAQNMGGPGGPTAAAIVLVSALSLTACSSTSDALRLFDEVKEKGAEVEEELVVKAGETIDRYCDSVPQGIREKIRERVNAKATKGSLTATCFEDAE